MHLTNITKPDLNGNEGLISNSLAHLPQLVELNLTGTESIQDEDLMKLSTTLSSTK
jgi:hypothetical protein